MDIPAATNKIADIALARHSSAFAEFSKKITAAAQWLAPANIAERRRLDRLANTAAKAVLGAIKTKVDAQQARALLDNAWLACGNKGFAWAMGKSEWIVDGVASPPVHAAIAIKDPQWALKLAALAPAGSWSNQSDAVDNWFRPLPESARKKAMHQPKKISAIHALCAYGIHLDDDTWAAIAAIIAKDGIPAPQGDDLVLALHILDDSGQPGKKTILRSWVESEDISSSIASTSREHEPQRQSRSL